MAGVAGLLLEDAEISAGFVRTLERLRDLQGPEGQIASNFANPGGAAAQVSFGTLAPRIDAATWYLIGIALGARRGVLDPERFRDSAIAVVRLLDALEYNGRHLIYIPPGGNWADEYIYEGYVLYDQVLRAWALRLLGQVLQRPAWTRKSEQIAETLSARYWPQDPTGRWHPVASDSPLGPFDAFDLAACSLLAVSRLGAGPISAVLDAIDDRYLVRGTLPPAFAPVIDESHPGWPALRRYHLHAFRNRPHEYHNGGIWPVWLGWLALALAGNERWQALQRLRAAFAAALDAQPVFAFDEYLHGLTGAAGGTSHMAYSATGVVFLHLAGTPAQSLLLGS